MFRCCLQAGLNTNVKGSSLYSVMMVQFKILIQANTSIVVFIIFTSEHLDGKKVAGFLKTCSELTQIVITVGWEIELSL